MLCGAVYVGVDCGVVCVSCVSVVLCKSCGVSDVVCARLAFFFCKEPIAMLSGIEDRFLQNKCLFDPQSMQTFLSEKSQQQSIGEALAS